MTDRTTSGTDLPGRGRELASLAALHAEQADRESQLPPVMVEQIVAAGFARHFVPTRWNGRAGSVTDLFDAVSAVAEGCTSAAWSASVIASAGRMGAFLPLEGQQDLWAKGADTLVVGALMPRGDATPVPGGWRVSGSWSYASVVDFSDWALVCALVTVDGRQVPWFFALPREDYTVTATWASTGMRGTGSNSLAVEDAFVPEHRGFTRQNMIAGHGVGSDAPCHTAPLRLVSGLLFGAPAVGAARTALRAFAELSAPVAPDNPAPRAALARAAVAVNGAGLLMERAARVADAPRCDPADLARNPADCAYAVEQLLDAVERLTRAAGSAALSDGSALERIWRDLHSLSSHVALRFDPAAVAYGARLLELSGGPDAR